MANDFVTKLQEPLNIAGIAVAVGCAVVGLVFRKKTIGIGLLFAAVTAVAFTMAHSFTPTPVTGGMPRTSRIRAPVTGQPQRAPVNAAPVRRESFMPTSRTLGGQPILPEIYHTGGMPATTGVVTSEIYQ